MLKKGPLISVIIPVYNVEKYLHDCIDSVISQTYRNLEIILIDDGSTDTSGKICDAYAKKYSYIRVIHEFNQGASYARNKGLKISNGEYLLFVDSDDTIHSSLCELGLNYLREYQVDWIMWNVTRQYKKPFSEGLYSGNKYLQLLCFSFIDRGFGPSCGCHLFRKQIFQMGNIRFSSMLKNYEDLAVVLQYALLAKSIFFINRSLYFYRNNPTSVTHTYDFNSTQSTITEIEYFMHLCQFSCPFALPYLNQKNLLVCYRRIAEETKNHQSSLMQKCNELSNFFHKPIICSVMKHLNIFKIKFHIFIVLFLVKINRIKIAYLLLLSIQRVKCLKNKLFFN